MLLVKPCTSVTALVLHKLCGGDKIVEILGRRNCLWSVTKHWKWYSNWANDSITGVKSSQKVGLYGSYQSSKFRQSKISSILAPIKQKISNFSLEKVCKPSSIGGQLSTNAALKKYRKSPIEVVQLLGPAALVRFPVFVCKKKITFYINKVTYFQGYSL